MDVTTLLQALENSAPGEWMRHNLKAMPFVEATHVLAIVVVFGTILIVDLRLLGYPNVRRSYVRLHDALVRWTWAAFGLAVITGVLMFLPNATTYYNNTAFWLKMAAMLCAGINMAIFETTVGPGYAKWDKDVPVPMAGRVAAALSITLWTAVIVFGRWIGFTKGYNFDIPEDIDFDFSGVGLLLQALPAFC
jgi:hypothetical protein